MSIEAKACCPAPAAATPALVRRLLNRVDPVIAIIAATLAAIAASDPAQLTPSLAFVLTALRNVAPLLAVSVLISAWIRATDAQSLLGRVTSRAEPIAILAATALGTLSPLCSCGVIPAIAGLLRSGVALGPIMAFWLSSPLMDPNMFVLTASELGLDFAIARTGAAIFIGLLGGFSTAALVRRGFLARPLRQGASGCTAENGSPTGCGTKPRPVWSFWRHADRRATFAREAGSGALFIGRWIALAFLLESLLVAYVPAESVARLLGSGGWLGVPVAVALGIPAYMNGYAATPLVAGLVKLGLAPGTALAFLVAGAVTSIPASVAVAALVRRSVFLLYLGLAVAGALATGFAASLAWAL